MNLAVLARILGFAGVIPFVTFSIGTWITLPLVTDSHYILVSYAALILSFMGAIHWGLAMAENNSKRNMQLGMSVLPALLGWLALLLPLLHGYIVLIACFIFLYLADRQATKSYSLAEWYLPLRMILTTIVIICLSAASLSLLIQ
jgi:hypothetical protein